MGKHAENYCTSDRWAVSVTTGTDIAGAILNVSRFPLGLFVPGPHARADADGHHFETREQAWAFARSQGYSVRYLPRAMLGRPWDSPKAIATEQARRARALARARERG